MDDKVMEFEANFSVLDRYGTDVTKEEFITNPAIGRDQQIKDLILILLTPEKSAILIGKPGIGKTAIVEGLAYRLQKDDVPDALKGYSIINIKTASLLGTMPSGESKVQKMIDELKTKEKLILFIDEVHMLIGATDSSALDFANIFKEGLGRGSIKVIGATTTEEYERYILRDKAFTRRFQKIEVPEPTHEETIEIMLGTLPKFEKQTGRKMKYTPFIQERIMDFLVDITSEYKRVFSLGSRYPDVCLTLLKQAFSYTVYDNRPYVDIFDIRKAIENSKNIYPDVIKKELPKFDELFNDIILEEKGEKPVEEWRKDGKKTRAEIDSKSIEDEDDTEEEVNEAVEEVKEEKEKENNKENEEQTEEQVREDEENKKVSSREIEVESPEQLKKMSNVKSNIIDSSKKKKYKNPILTVPTDGGRFMDLGATNFAYGRKSKINRTGESKGIDDIILGSDVETMKVQKDKSRNQTRYIVNQEIMPGVTDSQLLGSPIESTLNMRRGQSNQQQDMRYRNGNVRRGQQQGGYGPQGNYGPYQGGPYGPPPQGYGPQGNYGPYQDGPYGPPPQGYGPQGNYGPYQDGPYGQMPNDNRNRRPPERMNINDQNFDRYNNYFHPDQAYDNRGRDNRNMSSNSMDAMRGVVQNNKSNHSKVKGMVSLSDSDSDTLFGYLNKGEERKDNNSNKFDDSLMLSGGLTTIGNSGEDDNDYNRQVRQKDVLRQSNRYQNQNRNESTGTDGIRSLIDADDNRPKENNIASELDEFPMLNIMKGISNDNESVEKDITVDDKKNDNNSKPNEEKQGDKKWNYLPDEDLLGDMGTIDESGNINLQVNKKEDSEPKKAEEDKETDDGGEFINFSELNNKSAKMSLEKEEKVDVNVKEEPFKYEEKKEKIGPFDNLSLEEKSDVSAKEEPFKYEEKKENNNPFDNLSLENNKLPNDFVLEDEPATTPKYDLNLENNDDSSDETVFDDFFG